MQFNYEELIQDDPVVQNLLAERELRGKAEGEIKARKESILSLLTARFSSALAVQAQSAIIPIENAETLKMLFQQLLQVPDEQAVRLALDLPSE
jgi:predicted transposase YdaD